MNYAEALEYIHGIGRFGKKLGLENITRLMRALGDPQDRLRFIHIAGTNGKGSTAAYLSSVMRAAGYRTGLYTSPYLQRFTERIRVDGREIPEARLASLAGTVRSAIAGLVAAGHQHPTEFEVVTAIAFLYYAQEGCDVVALEVGLGGRLDSTNVIKAPLAAVIATIDFDHVAQLGDTLEKIAFEKAGIIKPGCETVLYPQPDSVREVFETAAQKVGARLHVCDFSTLRGTSFGLRGQTFDYGRHKGLKIALLGDYQIRNAALAVEAVEVINRDARGGIHVSDEALRRGLRDARWPGRMELLREKPAALIDAAHNPQCARALRAALDKYFPGRKKIFIFGVLKDKDYRGIIEAVIPAASAVFTVTPESGRALAAGELANILREWAGGGRADGRGASGDETDGCDGATDRGPAPERIWACDSIAEATERAIALASESPGSTASESPKTPSAAAEDGAVVCAFGSLYYIGIVRDLLVADQTMDL
jgi:dihydrofolate synthase/folylpolyglutamate synthase